MNAMTYGVFEWDGGNGGWYDAAKAVKVYKSESAAKKYADANNLVVRSQAFVKGVMEAK